MAIKQYILETNKIKFSINFCSNTMLIRGDSASGKTYLCNLIRALKNNPNNELKVSIPLDKTEVVSTPLELKAILEEKGKLIFIDRYDMLINDSNRKEVTDFINRGENLFILMYRNSESGLIVTTNSYVSIHREQIGNKIWLRCTCEP